ncbi:DAK2 domain protein [Pelotomaculum sp. FP]|uniref:DAK2 domain-containing protein n=1 Tax=Pelotomaculum sp. FP TaxID=261474 RepID=UPI0010671579|nr:DAK2 domain-containing protein [Pelotomaculum sp. FP]TEB16618.1 DAK2 domain protein [Pelotomaculum sp. FP]
MGVYSFDGDDLKLMFRGAVDLLEQSKGGIDALNVFPVPDGDTGTNMYHTLASAVKEAVATNSNHIGLVAEAAARGGLIGARGNSGVILSQVLQGFARSLRVKERATAVDIIEAFEDGAGMAYQAVLSPVEGTILTVVRKTAEEAAAQRSNNLLRMMVAVLKKAFTALKETPNQLPALKEAGVVDAGGKGFVVILEGCLSALKSASPAAKAILQPVAGREAETGVKLGNTRAVETIGFCYCTEFLLTGNGLPLEKIKQELSTYGDSLMVVGSGDLTKIHIHSNHPGLVIEYCLKYGALNDLKITNMREQNKAMRSKGAQTDPDNIFSIISVGFGMGIIEIMKNLGADMVIAGGQTLNPSAGEILRAIEEMKAEQVVILPNNKNVVMTAELAGSLSLKDTIVVPTKSIPQGLSALLTLNPGDDIAVATQKMNLSLSSVRTGEITRAVRDTNYAGMEITKDSIIGLADGDLKTSGKDLSVVMEDLLAAMLHDEGRLVTLYFGEGVSSEQAERLADQMMQKFSGHEFEVQNGGQPVYDFIISVE